MLCGVRVASGRGHEDTISEAMEQFARVGEMELLICRTAGTTTTATSATGSKSARFTKEAGGED